MERRRAIAIAAATAATTAGAVAAIAANFGLLGFTPAVSTHLGNLEAGQTGALVQPIAVPSTPGVTARGPSPSSGTLSAARDPGRADHDDEDEDHEDEDEDHEEHHEDD